MNQVGRFEAIASHRKIMLLKCQQEPCCKSATGFFIWQKGKLIMGYTQAVEMANLMDLEQGIRWHLRHNHYPTVPSKMIPIAMEAIRFCQENRSHEPMLIFFVNQDFGWSVPARVIVEAYHLEPWVS
jgi:hypothetical protein